MSFLDEIAAKLIAQGVTATIYHSSAAVIPQGDGPFLSMVETGGMAPRRTHNDTATECPSAQIVARSTSNPTARTLLKAAYDALGGPNGLHNVVLSGTAYLRIVPRQGITDIGTDAVGRPMVAFNIDTEKQPS